MNCGWPIAPAHDPVIVFASIAAGHDRQRLEQLVSEEIRSTRFRCKRGERLEHGVGAGEPPVVRLEAPDRQHDALGDAVFRSNPAQDSALFHCLLSPQADDAGRHTRLEIAIEGDRELRLRAVSLDHARNRREAGERRVDQLVAVAARVRFSDQLLEPFLEGTRRHLRRTLLRRQDRCRQKQGSHSHGVERILDRSAARVTTAFSRRRRAKKASP